MFKVTFFLKSGQSFSVDLEKISIKTNGVGDLIGMEWTGERFTLPHLKYVRIEDISAITSVEVEDQTNE